MSDIDDSMQDVARSVQSILPPNTGFIVLAFDYGEGPGRRSAYVSNAGLEGALGVMREFVRHASENWGKHVERGPEPPSL